MKNILRQEIEKTIIESPGCGNVRAGGNMTNKYQTSFRRLIGFS